ncbi:MAG: HRDC domain-containing protein [Bdellovibrio sp.]|nr:HRDC domain-containing protein [Bdellovibrio sp.]
MCDNNFSFITKSNEILDLCLALKQETIIGFDTEFVKETSFFPRLEIIQVATEKQSWVVDAHMGSENLDPLLQVFKDKNILKVGHAIQGDQECFYTAHGFFVSPCLDTSIASALCGYGDSVGLSFLLKEELGVQIKKGHARSHWGVRPLPKPLLEYAHADVIHLVYLCKKLLEKLEKLNRKAWALELSAQYEDPLLYVPDPIFLAEKLASGRKLDVESFAALVALMKWREARVRELNIPRRWLADDGVLLDLAMVRPKDVQHLKNFRGISKGEMQKSGKTILETIHNALVGAVTPHKFEVKKTPTAKEQQVINLLTCYAAVCAKKHQIALKYLIKSSQYLQLIRSNAKNPHDWPYAWVEEKILTQKACELIGEELWSFLKGEIALCIKDKEMKLIDLKKHL